MGTPIRPSSEISQLYKQLADQISAKNTREVRRVYKELLRSGEPIGAIVALAMSSVHKVENHRESIGSQSAINKPSGAQQISVGLRQSATEVALQQAPSVDLHIDRSECAPVVLKQLRRADEGDRPPNALPALRRSPTEITQVTSEAETPEPAAVNWAGGLDIHHEPITDTSDDPRSISPAGVAQSPRPGSGLQLVARLAMRRAADDPRSISPAGVAQSPRPGSGLQLVARLAMRRAADDPRLISPAGVAQSPSLGSGLQSIGRLATRTIIVLTAALVATVGVILLLSGHRPADQYRAAALQPAVVSPPTLAIAAGAAGLSGAALSPTITVASAGLSEEERPTAIMPSVTPTEKATVIAAAPAIVPTEAPASRADVSALLERGDALLATGDIASARLFYEEATMAGDAMAALRLGESYDSRFLAVAGLTGVHSDPALAARWYRRASELGASVAEVLLKSTEDRRH